LAITLLLLNNHQAPAWRAKLNQYPTYLRTTGKDSYHVLTSAHANQPVNFTPGMSAETFNDSVIFDPSYNLTPHSAELQPMPYPPQEVVCVLLGDGGQLQLVYVTLHSNLYNADWIVHIPTDPWDSSMLRSSLASLGCSLTK
jgi:hypothetical protein